MFHAAQKIDWRLIAVAHTYRTSVFLNPTVEGGGVHTLTPDGS